MPPLQRLIQRLALAALPLVSLSLAAPAGAFCRTTTCDPNNDPQRCSEDDHGCPQDGEPLAWEEQCVTFSVQQDGSKLRNISYETADKITAAALKSWIGADCSGSKPSIGVLATGPVECGVPEYNTTRELPDGTVKPPGPNANVIMFQDESWPYAGGNTVIALTTITFDPESGQIFDADIEVNTFKNEITTTDDPDLVKSDLQSVLTHEVGHLFGLAHTDVPTASLYAKYDRGDLSFRTLSTDDQSGMCAVYPPDPNYEPGTCPAGTQPRHGFSTICNKDLIVESGCSFARVGLAPRSNFGAGLALLGLFAAAGVGRRKRSR